MPRFHRSFPENPVQAIGFPEERRSRGGEDHPGIFQVVFLEAWRPALEEWLRQHGGAFLFPIPIDEDEAPTFCIGVPPRSL